MTRSITDVSNQFVRDAAAESPMLAVYLGLPSAGGDRRPLAGRARQALRGRVGHARCRRTRLRWTARPIGSPATSSSNGCNWASNATRPVTTTSDLNVIASPVQHVRMLFDLLPRASDDDYADIARRMAAVPDGARRLPSQPARGRWSGPGVSRPPGRQVRRAVRHVRRRARRHRVLREAGRRRAVAPGRSPTSSRSRPRRPMRHTRSSRRSCAPSSARTLRSRTPSVASATRSRRATSSAPPSTSTRPTPGGGRSS